MAIELNIKDVSKLIGISIPILRGMRARESISLLSGPPYCKNFDTKGETKYVYKKHEVLKWLKRRTFRITAGDAAAILGISRMELLGTYNQGIHSRQSRKGKLVINTGKNIYFWWPTLSINNKASA